MTDRNIIAEVVTLSRERLALVKDLDMLNYNYGKARAQIEFRLHEIIQRIEELKGERAAHA